MLTKIDLKLKVIGKAKDLLFTALECKDNTIMLNTIARRKKVCAPTWLSAAGDVLFVGG